MELHEALSLARAAKAIEAENREVPVNAALVVLAREIERLGGILSEVSEAILLEAETEYEREKVRIDKPS